MSIGQRVKKARTALGLSQAALASKVGITQATLSDLENDKSKGSAKLASIANSLRVRSFWLETGRGSPELEEEEPASGFGSTQKTPIYSTQGDNFGYISKYDEYSGSFDGIILTEKCYALRIKGDSFGERIQSGDILIIDMSVEIFPGDMVVVELNSGKRAIWRLRFNRNNETSLDQICTSPISTTLDNTEIISMHKVTAIIPR